MHPVFLISRNARLIASTCRFVQFVHKIDLKVLSYPGPDSERGAGYVPHQFTLLADQIEALLAADSSVCIPGAVGILDPGADPVYSLDDLNPCSTSRGDEAAIMGMLILAFPEVHWVFAGRLFPEAAPGPWPSVRNAHTICARTSLQTMIDLHAKSYVSLFDPAALRNRIRKGVLTPTGGPHPGKRWHPLLPTRNDLAAAIDEEDNYAFFSSYAAYRIGFRALAIHTFEMMDLALNQPAALRPRISLIVEDFYLEFADKPDVLKSADRSKSLELSRLEDRDELFPGLKDAKYRIALTSGQEAPKRNYDYYSSLRNVFTKIMLKPTSGIFALWEGSGLRDALWRAAQSPKPEASRETEAESRKAGRGLAPGYNWPPKVEETAVGPGGHSAPGRLLLIANRLIARAGRVYRSTSSVPEGVYGAMLALDAEEYLGFRTPTKSLEAMALRHKLEVTSECLFYGVAHNMEVDRRLDEIEHYVQQIGQWFDEKTREQSELNVKIKIVGELILIFRNYNQFDEEQICLARVRAWVRRLHHKRRRFALPPLYWGQLYLDSLINNTAKFVTVLLMWTTAFSAYFTFACPQNPHHRLSHGIFDAVNAFFCLQPPHAWNDYRLMEHSPNFAVGPMVVTIVAITLGILHLGAFISHLYTHITRR